jgi:hypothetical protein
VIAERDGLGDLLRAHRDTFERHLPSVAKRPANDAERDAVPALTANVEWIRRDLAAQLIAASRTYATLAIDLGDRNVRVARILRVAQHGRVAMLLAEDAGDGSSIAIPISAVRGIAEPPRAAGAETAAPGARATPWRPLEGQPHPPGHAPCPCGSGRKYRGCCRQTSLPS